MVWYAYTEVFIMRKCIIILLVILLMSVLSVFYRYTVILNERNEKRVESIPIDDKVEITEIEALKPDIIEEEVNIKKVICIDPGHQLKADYTEEPIGPNSDMKKPKVSNGTIGIVTKKPEYELNLEVSLKLKDRLEAEGFVVILTRETHDVNISNSERAKIANLSGADIFVRIHANQRNSPDYNGISVLCPSQENEYTSTIYDESNALAHVMLDALILETVATDMGISYRDDISGFNWSEVPVILIELGFMSNPKEDERMNTERYQNKLVTGMINGILEYFSEKN